MIHKVAEHGKNSYNRLLDEIRDSPVVNAGETGWREDSINGYIWSFPTPSVCYFLYRRSRANAVVKEALLTTCSGCWYPTSTVHTTSMRMLSSGVGFICFVMLWLLCRNKLVIEWTKAVRAIYRHAMDVAKSNFGQMQRVHLLQRFESRLLELATPYLTLKDAPQRVLAKRIDRLSG